MKVSDVMEKKFLAITPDATLRQASRIIFGANISGIPVINKEGKLVGIIVEKDILSQFYPSQREYIEDYTLMRDFEGMEEKATVIMNLPVKKFMSKRPLTISPQTPLLRAGSLMMTKRVSRLPVVGEKRKVVGMISLENIFQAIVRQRFPVATQKSELFARLAKFFDLAVSWPERLKYEIPFMLKYFKKHGVKRVLDLGCGTGEHALRLAKLGFKVTGLDQEKEMIKVAQEKAESQSQRVKKNLAFSLLPTSKVAQLREKFEAVICMGNAVANFLNLEEEIFAINKVLTPKALFIFHLRNFAKLLKEHQRFLNFNLSTGGKTPEKEFAFLRFYDHRPDGLLELNIETLASDGKRWRSYGLESTFQRPFTKADLKKILGKIGFKKFQFKPNFGGRDYGGSNEFVVVVAIR